jgi:hypothetical protein
MLSQNPLADLYRALVNALRNRGVDLFSRSQSRDDGLGIGNDFCLCGDGYGARALILGCIGIVSTGIRIFPVDDETPK